MYNTKYSACSVDCLHYSTLTQSRRKNCTKKQVAVFISVQQRWGGGHNINKRMRPARRNNAPGHSSFGYKGMPFAICTLKIAKHNSNRGICPLKGFKPKKGWKIDRVPPTIDPKVFFQKYISQRKPGTPPPKLKSAVLFLWTFVF